MADRQGGGNRRGPMVRGANPALEKLKNEVAAELGFANYDQMDKGDLPARVHGAIGGTITKRLIEFAQQSLMANGGLTSVSNLDLQKYRTEMVQDLQNAEPPVRN